MVRRDWPLWVMLAVLLLLTVGLPLWVAATTGCDDCRLPFLP